MAQSLHEVETSTALAKLKDLPRRPIDEGITKKSNFAKLFKGRNAGAIVFTWLGDHFPGFNNGRVQTQENSALVEVKRKFEITETKQGKHVQTVDVFIYIPRPWIENGAEYGMFPEIRNLQPPALIVDHEETLKVNGYQAKLYVHSGQQGCSVVLNLSRSSVMNMSVEDCGQNQRMIELLEQFDLHRLNQKLES